MSENTSQGLKEGKSEYQKGKHPNSQAALNRNGRPKAYGMEKERRYLSITEEGWQGAQAVARAYGCSGLSEMIEKLGRGDLNLTN